MTAAILTIGTEITRGELQDANSAWLSSQLTNLGFEVTEIRSVPDHQEDIVDALRSMSQRHVVVVCTGGLGPTSDDITAQAAAATAGVALQRNETAYALVQRRLSLMGRDPTPSHARMAELPVTADVLGNPEGSASAFRLTMGTAQCFFLPGVPREMQRIFEDLVTPRIGPMVTPRSYQIVLRSYGLPESVVGERLADLEAQNPGLTLGYRVVFPEVKVKVLVHATDLVTARALAERIANEVRTRLGDAVYGEVDDSFAAAVGRDLRARGWTLALGESCTGGLIGALLTAVPGSSDYLLLDAVTYANSAKERVLGVPSEVLIGHGAVSSECVRCMAEGARRIASADVGLGVSGIAGPSGGSADKPVGLVYFAIARADGTTVVEKRFLGDRTTIQRAAAFHALSMVREACRGPVMVAGADRCG